MFFLLSRHQGFLAAEQMTFGKVNELCDIVSLFGMSSQSTNLREQTSAEYEVFVSCLDVLA